MFDQFVADLDIVCRWCTRTLFAEHCCEIDPGILRRLNTET